MTILQGLSAKMSENVHCSFSSVMGCFKSNRNTLSAIKRTTIDFELAKLFPSPFGHVELSFAGGRTGIVSGYSAPAPQTRNYCYADPDTARNELFKSVLNPEAVNSDNDMLSFLQSKEGLKASGIKGHEKKRQEMQIESIEAIRERNKKLITISGSLAKHLPELAPVHADGGANASTPEKQAAMTDVLIAALKAGLTNVVTYTIDDLGTPITGLPGNETDRVGIHPLGHDEAFGGVPAWKTREQIRISHVNQIKTIVEKLKQVPEGNGTMFDNTMIMYFPENGETHHGIGTESPFRHHGRQQLQPEYRRPLHPPAVPRHRRSQDPRQLVHHAAQRPRQSDRALRRSRPGDVAQEARPDRRDQPVHVLIPSRDSEVGCPRPAAFE